jgi:hypothetical protein
MESPEYASLDDLRRPVDVIFVLMQISVYAFGRALALSHKSIQGVNEYTT